MQLTFEQAKQIIGACIFDGAHKINVDFTQFSNVQNTKLTLLLQRNCYALSEPQCGSSPAVFELMDGM